MEAEGSEIFSHQSECREKSDNFSIFQGIIKNKNGSLKYIIMALLLL